MTGWLSPAWYFAWKDGDHHQKALKIMGMHSPGALIRWSFKCMDRRRAPDKLYITNTHTHSLLHSYIMWIRSTIKFSTRKSFCNWSIDLKIQMWKSFKPREGNYRNPKEKQTSADFFIGFILIFPLKFGTFPFQGAMAEVHIIGTLIGATEFPSANLCCKYKFITGDGWTLLEGKPDSRTQVDIPLVSIQINHRWYGGIRFYPFLKDQKHAVFSQPIDLHYSTTTLKGWPKIQFEVFHQDAYGRLELCKRR